MGTVTTVISAMIRKEYTGRRNNSLLKCGWGWEEVCAVSKTSHGKEEVSIPSREARARQGFFPLRK